MAEKIKVKETKVPTPSKKSDNPSKSCWYCGNTQFIDCGDYIECQRCHATWNPMKEH